MLIPSVLKFKDLEETGQDLPVLHLFDANLIPFDL